MNVKMQKQVILDELNRLKTSDNILKEFQDFFAHADQQLGDTFDKNTVFQPFYDALKQINDRYIYDTQHLEQSNLENDEKIQLEKKQLRDSYIYELKQLDKDYMDQKSQLKRNIKKINNNFLKMLSHMKMKK